MEKLLDKYFAKKVVEQIEFKYCSGYYMDTKIIKTKRSYDLYIKRKDQKDEYYKCIIVVSFANWVNLYISFITNFDQSVRKYIEEVLQRR